ncbi:sel1 repeat family protein [Shewanella sp. SM55]|nr:tetratricopeptide repeat protein [Shewanella sp. SM55]MCU8063431.1 sel1 repeat family protein [Shewanella sp. SM55]
MLTKLLIWTDMKTKWSFIAVALTALLSVTPAAVQAKDWAKVPLVEVKKAAEQGDAAAQSFLGSLYRYSLPMDYKQALHWYTKAAEQGHADGQFGLGNMYRLGDGVPRDYKQALHWYTKAAEQGVAMAQYFLARMYRQANGVPRDYKQAYAWYSAAAANGYESALSSRDDMANLLSPDDLISAQKLAAEYFEKSQPK